MIKVENALIQSDSLKYDQIFRTSENSIKQCLEFGVLCQGVSENGTGTRARPPSPEERYRVREVPLLKKDKEKTVWIKKCVGNLAYYQIADQNIEIAGLNASNAVDRFKIKYKISAQVNFKQGERIWYRDSQLYNAQQVNEYSIDITDNIKWINDKDIEIEIDIELAHQIPGFYTILSKIVDILGQPVLEFNWIFRVTSSNEDLDEEISQTIEYEKLNRRNGLEYASRWAQVIRNSPPENNWRNLHFEFKSNW